MISDDTIEVEGSIQNDDIIYYECDGHMSGISVSPAVLFWKYRASRIYYTDEYPCVSNLDTPMCYGDVEIDEPLSSQPWTWYWNGAGDASYSSTIYRDKD